MIQRARARFGNEGMDHAFQQIGVAVDRFSFEKLASVPRIDPSRIIFAGTQAIEEFRQNNAQLIADLPRTMAEDVGRALGEVEVRSLHVSEVGDILSKRFNVAESKGEFWARDQTLKLYADVNETRNKAAGVTKYEWGTSEDERVRGRPGGVWAHSPSDHYVLDKTIQLWAQPPIVDPATGRRAHPGKDYQCRCTAYPHFDGESTGD